MLRTLKCPPGKPLQEASSLTSTLLPSMLFFKPLFNLHKLANPHRYALKQVLPFVRIRSVPVRLRTSSVVVHTRRNMTRRATFLRHPTCSLLFRTLRFHLLSGFRARRCPVFQLVAVAVPNAVYAAGHAAIIRFFRPWRNQNTSNSCGQFLKLNIALCLTRFGIRWLSEQHLRLQCRFFRAGSWALIRRRCWGWRYGFGDGLYGI